MFVWYFPPKKILNVYGVWLALKLVTKTVIANGVLFNGDGHPCVLVSDDYRPSSNVHLRMNFLNGEIHTWIMCLPVWIEIWSFSILRAAGDHEMANSWICQTLRSIVSNISSLADLEFLVMKQMLKKCEWSKCTGLIGKGSMWRIKWWREEGTPTSCRNLFKDKAASRE